MSTPISGNLAFLRTSGSPQLSRIARGVETIETAHNTVQKVRRWYRSRTMYAVRLTSDDGVLYRETLARLLDMLPEVSQRALRAYTVRHHDYDYDEPVPASPRGMQLRFTYDAKHREATVDIGGHPVRVAIETPDPPGVEGRRQRTLVETLRLEAKDHAGLRALQGWLAEIVAESNQRTVNPSIKSVGTYGDWRSLPDQPWRTLDTVVLATGQRERLVADLEDFLGREQNYVRLGMPWHRGYLLYGPPGTGKTSLVKGLAHHFGLDLWTLSLSDLKQDANLLGLIGEVSQRSILLIEDVDAFRAATGRDSEGNEVTISGLLNAIDGVATPHGLITFFTTNHPETLDPALTRPGRIDVKEEIGLPTGEQASRLFQVVYGVGPRTLWRVPDGTTTADLMEIFKRHLDDPDAAEAALRGGGRVTPEAAKRIAHVGRALGVDPGGDNGGSITVNVMPGEQRSDGATGQRVAMELGRIDRAHRR